jgi:hypothetical protein
VAYFRKLRDGFPDGSTDRARAEQVLANFEVTDKLVVQFCHHMREKVHSCGHIVSTAIPINVNCGVSRSASYLLECLRVPCRRRQGTAAGRFCDRAGRAG